MNKKAWCLFNNYEVDCKGVIMNIKTRKTLTKTVKGYTIGYYINKRFYSLHQLRLLLIEKKEINVPF